jgi:hypothetical protein
MTIHYPTDHRFGRVLVSVDNKVATKVSVWIDNEDKPRQRFTGDNAYDDAMELAFKLSEFEDEAENEGFEFATGTGRYSGSSWDTDY